MPIHILKLIDKQVIAKNTIELLFEKPQGFHFIPGQYGGFTLINPAETDASGITRRFSLLSSPLDNHIAIATRIQNSAYKRELTRLAIGSEIKFAGPSGNFLLHEDTSVPAVFIAGGIGIAPFYSMIRHAAQQSFQRPIHLFYGNQTAEDAAFLNELNLLQQNHAWFSFVPALANPPPDWQGETGFITYTLLKKYVPDFSVPIYYVCGSPAMVTALQETLMETGIASEKIKVEDFPGY